MRQFRWMVISLFALGLMGAGRAPAGAATYSVSPVGSDENAGTEAAPWRSLQQAAAVMGPGDTALIADGEYEGGVEQTTSGEPEAPITFRAVNAGGAVVRGDQAAGPDGFTVNAADHIVIEGLTVEGASRAGISIVLSNQVTVRGCRLLNNPSRGIRVLNCDDLLLEGNECAFATSGSGISLDNGGDRPIVRLNRLHDNRSAGLQIVGEPSNIQPELGTRGDGVTTGAVIERNVIYANGEGGGAAINLASVRSSRFVNNLLYHNLAGGIAGWDGDAGLEWGVKENLILHNTIYFRPGEGRWCISLKNGSSGNLIQNNILSGGARGGLEIDDDSPVQSDYNLLLRAGSQHVATNEDLEAFLPLDVWQADTGNDMNSVGGEALFAEPLTEPFDFRLLADSPAVNAGADRADVTVDLDGVTRPQNGRWDLGCYESGH